MGTIKPSFLRILNIPGEIIEWVSRKFQGEKTTNPSYEQQLNHKEEVYFGDILIIWNWGSRENTKLPPFTVEMKYQVFSFHYI